MPFIMKRTPRTQSPPRQLSVPTVYHRTCKTQHHTEEPPVVIGLILYLPGGVIDR